MNYKGVWPTMIAFFDKKNKLDLQANKDFADYLINLGADGLFANCQSSEMFFLTTDEKVAVTKAVIEAAKGRVPVISSGHTSDTLDEQIKELKAVAEIGTDVVVLVSNRLDMKKEGTSAFKKNLDAILKAIPDVKFGMYECPFPYLRLLTDEELLYCANTKRIVFLKDVSCDAKIQRRRIEVLKGKNLALFNANTETLLESFKAGYVGYNGVMGNFHIDLYKWMYSNFKTNPKAASSLQNELTRESSIEKFNYPVNAKYHAVKRGLDAEIKSRRIPDGAFNQDNIKQVESLMKWENSIRTLLSNGKYK
jgi:4-hydroxy-tetrahydrodipicolinate synthase